ncbi:Alkali-sensitive linkage protein 1 [Tolypocladium ophioglossoides CBS 100239]|uniref:Alkali-sensitive linkage protein 1 n=1 Tax=Tolypocladium ophioglossoides (strain CBS 100239) TaxID=1163406 RepID=A0A0L0NJI9_TOLOC|nr:Alkali-sensitive linkage protein 1 [Tolypocladium ophioglossoides CBS 100239]
MYAKNIVALTAFAALAERALAFNSHRHLHRRDVEKRAIVTDWVTVWETVDVTPGQEESEAAATEFVDYIPPAATPTTLVTAIQPAPQLPSSSSVSVPPVSQVPTTADNAAYPEVTTGALAKKRGIAYNDPGLADAFGASCAKCGWGYNWDSSAQGLDTKFNFIPMLWGDLPVHTSHWDADVTKALAGGAKAIFSFNEPDNSGQANMSPQDAANAHIKYMNKYAGKALIGAPAVTNSGNPGEGIQWLKNFMSACNGACRVDFCNVHWYSEAQYADTLFSHLDAAHQACGGKPVWLTEFAPVGDQTLAPDFLRKVIPKLDGLSYLAAYSYFMVAPGKLMGNGNSLSDIGTLYATL